MNYKTIFLTFSFGLLALSTSWGQKGSLHVTVHGIDTEEEGKLCLTVYHGEEGFPNDWQKGKRSSCVSINDSEMTVTFESLPYGEYAVTVLHDEDGDRVMDYNWVGIPTEGWVFSNEVFPRFRSPRYSESTFQLNSPQKKLSLGIDY